MTTATTLISHSKCLYEFLPNKRKSASEARQFRDLMKVGELLLALNLSGHLLRVVVLC